MSATVLMMNVIELRRSGRTANLEKDLTLVGRTAEILRSLRYECVLPYATSGSTTERTTGIAVQNALRRVISVRLYVYVSVQTYL